MLATDVVRKFLTCFADGTSRDALLSETFRLVGEAHGAPVLAFAVAGASAPEVAARGMEITFDGVSSRDQEHVLVWGTWSGDGTDRAMYHVVLRVLDGLIQEARFFEDGEHARWFAGL